MKKSWKRFLAVAAVLVLTLCVLSSCGDNTQTKIDEAVKNATDTLTKEKDDALAAAQAAADEALKTAQEAADATKAELEAKLTEAEEAAKAAAEAAVKEKDEAVAAAQAAAEEAVAAAKAEAEEAAKAAAEAATKEKEEAVAAAKAEAEEAAKAAAETAAKEKEEAVAAAQAAADEALKTAQEAADATKAELEGQVADLTQKLADAEAAALEGADAAVKNAQEAADITIKDLQDKLTEAKESAKTAAESFLKEKEEAVAAVKTELEAKVSELKTKVEDYEKQIAEAAAAAAAKAEEKAEEAKTEEAKTEEPAEEAKTEDTPKLAAVMSYADYAAAELDSEVTVEAYVQDCQGWWDGKITVYAQDKDGAYFIYNMACSEEDSKKLVPGTKIKVNGFKSEWSGEVEITDATFEFVEGEAFIAEAKDVTDLIGKDELVNYQNQLVIFKGVTIEAQDDGAAFNYKDAVGKTDDLYIKASKDGQTVSFCVEFYLRGQDTDVYKAVEGLQVGDVVDVTGYLYWYNGANPHVIAVTKAE